jgi:hypothetical protein
MERIVTAHFPVAGIDRSRAFSDQQPRPLPQGQWDLTGQIQNVPGVGPQPVAEDVYGRTTYLGVNVQGFEATTDRRRGGSRPGLSKYIPQAVLNVPDWALQHLGRVTTTGTTVTQPNQFGRQVWLVPVSQGNVAYAQAGDLTWTPANNATGNTPPLSLTGIVRSAANGQKLWFADGTNWCYFDPATGTVYLWKATAGTLPVDSQNNKPKLICNWRGRIVLAGWFKMPQAIYMSATDDPTDWDLARLNYSPSQAFATTVGPQNSPGSVVTALMPFNDDVLVIGCDHELWMVNGDPQAGGQISRITDAIGVAPGLAFTMDPYGTLYFVSNKMGIYSMVPGQLPQRISQPIENLIQDVNTGTNGIVCVWDDRFQGVRIYITPLDQPRATVHYFWEARTGAWWQVVHANPLHNPLCAIDFDGNTSTDRTVVVGSWDGYVRFVDKAAVDDDGTPISSEVWLGPILSKTFDDMRVDELVVDLGETSGPLQWSIHPGLTAEAALTAAPVETGAFVGGRNAADPVRVNAHALYLRYYASGAWSHERTRLRVTEKGPLTGRRK